MVRVLPLLGLALGSTLAEGVTPVEKVVELLEGLKEEVETDGKDEATSYDKFACFCKDTTKDKSTAITDGHDKIDQLSSDIESNTALKEEKEEDLQERKKKQEELEKELEEAVNKCMKEALEFEATIADLTKAVNSLDKAITAMKGAKPSFLQQDLAEQVRNSLELSEVLGMTKEPANVAAVESFLQAKVDPDDPTFKFHSGGIIETLETMHKDFDKKKTDTEGERDRAKKACDDLKKGLTDEMDTNSDAMDTLGTDIAGLQKTLGEDKESLVEKQDTLKDDQLYMKDLTGRCEARARDWDQRSSMRAGELKALTEALAVLKDGKDGQKSVMDLDKVNNRSFFLQAEVELPPAVGSRPILSNAKAQPAVVTDSHGPSFLQARSRARRALRGLSSAEMKRDRIVDFVRHEGVRLRSQMLATLSSQLSSNPFAKVKQLIQQLIERLLDEATQEATKKGFCDTEVGKAKKDRDHRNDELLSLSAVLIELDAKAKELDESIAELNETIPKLHETLNETTEARKDEKKSNLETIKVAKQGVEAVAEAIKILKVHFKKAAKALLQASPVDADTDGPGFKGSYKGKQTAGNNIIGLLEVIESDFDRTVRQTKQAEKEALEEFVEFERTSKADISAKEMTHELDTQDLEATQNTIKKKMGDLETAQSLLDDALKTLEDLKPMCIDTGMSYAERVAKREEEIAALKKAMCMLDPEGKESECR